MTVRTLDELLWHERALLESMLLALGHECLMLAHGHTSWLSRAADDVERLTANLREAEVLRAMDADAVAAVLDVAAAPTLSALASALGGGLGAVLRQHRDALRMAIAELTVVTGKTREQLAAGHEDARAGLLASRRPYAASGAGLLTHDDAVPASLVAFLR